MQGGGFLGRRVSAVKSFLKKRREQRAQRREQKRPTLAVAEAMAAQKLGKTIKARGGYEVTAGRTSAEDPTRVRLIIKGSKGNCSVMDITVPPTKGQERMLAISGKAKKVADALNRPLLKDDAISVAARGPKGSKAKSLAGWAAENLGRGEGRKGRPSTAVEVTKGNKARTYEYRGRWRRLRRIV